MEQGKAYMPEALKLHVVTQMIQRLRKHGTDPRLWHDYSILGEYEANEEEVPLRSRWWFQRLIGWLWSRSRLLPTGYSTPDIDSLHGKLVSIQPALWTWLQAKALEECFTASLEPVLPLDDQWELVGLSRPQLSDSNYTLFRERRVQTLALGWELDLKVDAFVKDPDWILGTNSYPTASQIQLGLEAYNELWNPVLFQHRLDTPASTTHQITHGTSGRGTKKTAPHSECS